MRPQNTLEISKLLGFNISIESIYAYNFQIKSKISNFISNYSPLIELHGIVEIDEVFLRGREGYNNGFNRKTIICFRNAL
jgi:hypothetical protein